MTRIVLVVAWLWVAAAAGWLSLSPSPTQAPPKSPAPSQATTPPPAAAPQPGYVGSDTCVTCHTDQETSINGSKHGQAKNPRTPAAGAGCESCHGPGQAHVDDDAKGHILKFGTMKPAEISQTCLTCHNRGTHAGWEGSTHAARNLTCTTCHSVHSPKSPEHQLVKPTETAGLRHVPSHAGGQDRAGGGAHAGARRQDVVLVVPQPARLDQQRQGPEGRQLRRRALHDLSHRDARSDALRARAGARELRDLPRSARVVERSDARRAHADALPALPHREQPPGDALRQGSDHHQQEQPDVRPVVRELPLEHSRLESPVGPVLHAVSGVVHAPIRHHDDCPARPRRAPRRIRPGNGPAAGAARASGRGATGRARDAPGRRLAQPLRADRARIPRRRPLHERGRRSGALPALPGPARRAAVPELPLRVRQAGRHVGLPRARRQRRLPRPAVPRELRSHRQAVADRQLAADSRSSTASTP